MPEIVIPRLRIQLAPLKQVPYQLNHLLTQWLELALVIYRKSLAVSGVGHFHHSVAAGVCQGDGIAAVIGTVKISLLDRGAGLIVIIYAQMFVYVYELVFS